MFAKPVILVAENALPLPQIAHNVQQILICSMKLVFLHVHRDTLPKVSHKSVSHAWVRATNVQVM